jgi:hypothetical protein
MSANRRKLLLVVVSVTLLAVSPASAQSGFPLISSAVVDYGHNTLTVSGTNFRLSPKVTLGTVTLTVQSATTTKIVATFPSTGLPSSFVPGTYFLQIVFNGGTLSIFTVDLGANGPVGPMGLQGPIGLTGPQGAQGPIGLMGATGATGATGPQGLKGNTGATGATGPAGAAGPAGTNGVSFNFRKVFDPAANYAVNDIVTYNGSTYVANATNGPNPLTPDANTSAWSVIAQQGAAGARGFRGLLVRLGRKGHRDRKVFRV